MSVCRKLLPKLLIAVGLAFGTAQAGRTQTADPLSIDEAVTLGRAHHPQAAAAEAQQEQAQAQLQQTKARRLPTLSASEDVTYSNDPVFAFGSKLRQARFSSSDFDLGALNHPAALSNFSASATATWTAFDGGAIRRQVDSARTSLEAARLNARYSQEQIASEITKLFYRVLLAQDEVTVADSALKRTREIAADIQDRMHSGLSLESDSLRTHLALRNTEDDLASAQSNVVLAKRDLFDAIGTPQADRPLVPPDVHAMIATPEPITTIYSPDARFDLQALRLQQQAAKQTLASIHATAWPQVSTYGHVENDAEHFVANGSGNWTLGAKVELHIFDGGARRAQEDEAEARQHLLAARERETALAARATVDSLQQQIGDLHRRFDTADAAISVQQEVLQTARDRYAAGLDSISDVLSGESDLSSAEFTRARIFYQICIARTELALASGSPLISKAGQP